MCRRRQARQIVAGEVSPVVAAVSALVDDHHIAGSAKLSTGQLVYNPDLQDRRSNKFRSCSEMMRAYWRYPNGYLDWKISVVAVDDDGDAVGVVGGDDDVDDDVQDADDWCHFEFCNPIRTADQDHNEQK